MKRSSQALLEPHTGADLLLIFYNHFPNSLPSSAFQHIAPYLPGSHPGMQKRCSSPPAIANHKEGHPSPFHSSGAV